ncbi:hypothetical protein FACS1894113_3940 [Alphaproteobacteria bacterium]|nr:hypothetical protein FACS1894113_3940 [Alphaproteobacteria bacterium]
MNNINISIEIKHFKFNSLIMNSFEKFYSAHRQFLHNYRKIKPTVYLKNTTKLLRKIEFQLNAYPP